MMNCRVIFIGKIKERKRIMAKCEICGAEVYFDKSPEYDVCSRCDKHICIDCGVYDPICGDVMCKDHPKEVNSEGERQL